MTLKYLVAGTLGAAMLSTTAFGESTWPKAVMAT